MWQATPEWKQLVLETMRDRGVTRAELSRRVEVSDAAITILFRPDTQMSRLVPRINEVLGISAPVQLIGDVVDEDLEELQALWKRLGKDDRKTLTDMAGVLARRRR